MLAQATRRPLGGGSALTLTRPDEVRAHLAFAAEQIRRCTVQTANRVYDATLSLPSLRQRTVAVDLDEPATAPPRGSVLEVRYIRGLHAYRFYSELLRADGPRRWVLAFPSVVERTDRRANRRLQVLGDARYAVRLHLPGGRSPRLSVRDISVGGIGFVAPDGCCEISPGDVFPATVELPREGAVPVILEVVHVRREGHARVAGCRFAALRTEDRHRLFRALRTA